MRWTTPSLFMYVEIPAKEGDEPEVLATHTTSGEQKTYSAAEWKAYKSDKLFVSMTTESWCEIKAVLEKNEFILKQMESDYRKVKPWDVIATKCLNACWHMVKRALVWLKIAKPVAAAPVK